MREQQTKKALNNKTNSKLKVPMDLKVMVQRLNRLLIETQVVIMESLPHISPQKILSYNIQILNRLN